jgi:hypothetical protein
MKRKSIVLALLFFPVLCLAQPPNPPDAETCPLTIGLQSPAYVQDMVRVYVSYLKPGQETGDKTTRKRIKAVSPGSAAETINAACGENIRLEWFFHGEAYAAGSQLGWAGITTQVPAGGKFRLFFQTHADEFDHIFTSEAGYNDGNVFFIKN